jgi:regulator of replication initiation timing
MAKYHKRCFDQIQGISKDNKELIAEVDQLRKQLKTAEKDQTELESPLAWLERAGNGR